MLNPGDLDAYTMSLYCVRMCVVNLNRLLFMFEFVHSEKYITFTLENKICFKMAIIVRNRFKYQKYFSNFR